MIGYVVGFMFNQHKLDEFTRVLLIKKTRPDWQKGLYNGIGGAIEEGETPRAAMQREFMEETGVEARSWIKFCRLVVTPAQALAQTAEDEGVVVFFYRCYHQPHYVLPRSITEEKVKWINPWHLPYNIINNLTWLLPAAMALSPVSMNVTEVV